MDIQNESEDFSGEVSKKNLVMINVAILVIFLVIVGGVYYWVSNKSKGQQVFPAGINYVSPKGEEVKKPVLLYDFAKLAESSDWVTYKGKIYPYSFQYPKVIAPLTFPNDKSDAVTFKVNELPPEQSLLLTVETISERDKNLVGKPEEFAKNYWKFFSGLKSLSKIESITNEKGMKGYKANYIVKGNNAITSDNYFFVIEGKDDILLHIGDIFPVEGKMVLNRLINSLEYQK
ncbi:MAG: hypothetical protein ACD_12C00084G0002 [uncultured bacterium]|nr:MAG: hypothetical protein ACD_12C00084G0002 [uncultured bacterium]